MEVLVGLPVKVLFGEVEGVGTDGDTDEASGDVIGITTGRAVSWSGAICNSRGATSTAWSPSLPSLSDEAVKIWTRLARIFGLSGSDY